MRIFLNTIYTALLALIIYLSFVFEAGKGFVGTVYPDGEVWYTNQATDIEANDNYMIEQGSILFLVPLLFQIARLKFKLKYTNLAVFLGCWFLQLLSLGATDGANFRLTLHYNPFFASWLVCFIAILPAFLLMWRDAYVQPLSKRRRHDAIGSLPAAGAVS